MTAPYGLLAPPPYAAKPSIVDRVLGRLFPTAQYTGLLDPEAQHGLQRQGLLNLGASLLQAGGPQAVQGGTLANLGSALQQSQVNFPQMAEQALQLQAYRSQLGQQQAVAEIAARHPITPGMSREDMYNRATDILQEMLTVPGAARLAEQMAPVVAAMKPEKPDRARWSFQTVDENGEPVLYRVNEDTGVKYRVGIATKGVKEPTSAERVAGSQYDSAGASIGHMKEIAARNPEAAKAAVAAINAGGWGQIGKAYAALRGFTNDKDANDFFTEYQNMLLTVTPTYGASRPTQQLMDLEKAASLPALGTGDWQTAFTHMDQRLADLKAKAGKALHPSPPAPGQQSKYRASNPFAP